MTKEVFVTDKQKNQLLRKEKEIFRRVCKGTLLFGRVMRGLQDMIDGQKTISESLGQAVTVPNLSSEALLDVATKQAKLYYMNPNYKRWDFIRDDEKNKTYEVNTWKPGIDVSSEIVREHFRALGFKGNVAAFVAWVAENRPEEWHVSIPDDTDCFSSNDGLRVPYFFNDGADRGICMNKLTCEWREHCVFVAFREIS